MQSRRQRIRFPRIYITSTVGIDTVIRSPLQGCEKRSRDLDEGSTSPGPIIARFPSPVVQTIPDQAASALPSWVAINSSHQLSHRPRRLMRGARQSGQIIGCSGLLARFKGSSVYTPAGGCDGALTRLGDRSRHRPLRVPSCSMVFGLSVQLVRLHRPRAIRSRVRSSRVPRSEIRAGRRLWVDRFLTRRRSQCVDNSC